MFSTVEGFLSLQVFQEHILEDILDIRLLLQMQKADAAHQIRISVNCLCLHLLLRVPLVGPCC